MLTIDEAKAKIMVLENLIKVLPPGPNQAASEAVLKELLTDMKDLTHQVEILTAKLMIKSI